MVKTKLVNRYGTGSTPIISSLDDALRAPLNQLSDWALGIPEMDGQDWAIVQTFVLAEFSEYPIGKAPMGFNINWLARAEEIADKILETYRGWLREQWALETWEYAFIYQWVYGSLSLTCAEVQIRKAMEQRKNENH